MEREIQLPKELKMLVVCSQNSHGDRFDHVIETLYGSSKDLHNHTAHGPVDQLIWSPYKS